MVNGLTTQRQNRPTSAVSSPRSVAPRLNVDSPPNATVTLSIPAPPVDDRRLEPSLIHASKQIVQTSPSLEVGHASPLTPLRPRDSQALDDLFAEDHINDIALDIHRYLARIYPEPCWEDEPYEFLRGYV